MASPPHMAQAGMMRVPQTVIPAIHLPPSGHHRAALLSPKGPPPPAGELHEASPHGGAALAAAAATVPATPGRSVTQGALAGYASPVHVHAAPVGATAGPPGRSGSGPLHGVFPASARCRSPAPQELTSQAPQAASTNSLRRSTGTNSAALLAPAAMAIAASTPMLRGRQSSTLLSSNGTSDGKGATLRAMSPSAGSVVSKSSLLAGSSLAHLIGKVTSSVQEKEQEIRRQQEEHRDLEEILSRSKEELQQLISVVSQLHELQQSAPEVLPDVQAAVGPVLGPERPRFKPKPPFFWQPSQEYAEEFSVSGEHDEIVTKTHDFEDQGWVIPVGGSMLLSRGGLYRWTVRIERKCPSRPQLQLGIHGSGHSQPWRLVTTSRCSWSRDDEPWQDRIGGDRLIDEGDYVHIEVDMRGKFSKTGTLALAINDEPFEQYFDDIPLNTQFPLIPVVSMGGNQSRVRLCPNY
eukprot:TRINITY_DN45556_c0_g1_i1.p1 TRINITY_DN45556_c0_g1~~TRINITY_DN45556_c0_g1_i1.p1  ORF type:complete len:464 (-),score=102.56 TRINITY_DN45556_c0_g1_i1:65-1456(-)